MAELNRTNAVYELSRAEKEYVLSAPTEEAVRMLREVGFHMHVPDDTREFDMSYAAMRTDSDVTLDGHVSTGVELVIGYNDGQKFQRALATIARLSEEYDLQKEEE